MSKYRAVIVRGISASLPAEALRMAEPGSALDLEQAQRQHDAYVHVLKDIVGADNVHELPADDSCPDCVFVEDPVIVCGATALLTRPGHPSRRAEGKGFLTVLEKLGLQVVQMEEPACLDGGDVLFTGSEFFIGISERTNQAGIDQVGRAFPTYPVHGVAVEAGLHLKSMMSMVNNDVIAIGASTAARSARQKVTDCARSKYDFLEFPNDLAANMVHLNGHILHVPFDEFPESADALRELSKYGSTVALSNSELNKVDGALTCCSVLVQ